MKRYKIKNLTNGAEATIETDGDLVMQPEYGLPERWVREGQEDISGHIETKTEDVMGEQITLYKLPAQYQIVVEDITAEVQAKEAEKVKKAQDLASLKAMKKGDIKNQSDLEDAFLKLKTILLG